MSGHVIGTLVAMPKKRLTIGYQTGKETFEIRANERIGIFLHEQARGRVANEERQQSGFEPG